MYEYVTGRVETLSPTAAVLEAGGIGYWLNISLQTFSQIGDRAEEEQVMLNRIHYSITEYLKEFNSDYRYKMILSSSTTGPVLNADPSLDLTQIILEGLNKKYAAEKPEETPKSVTGK